MLWILTALASPPSCATPFVFQGQPACVELTYVEGRTVLENRCEHPVWVDQSVRLPQDRSGPVPPKATVALRDLHTFTLGVDGTLFRAVASLVAECIDDAPTVVASK